MLVFLKSEEHERAVNFDRVGDTGNVDTLGFFNFFQAFFLKIAGYVILVNADFGVSDFNGNGTAGTERISGNYPDTFNRQSVPFEQIGKILCFKIVVARRKTAASGKEQQKCYRQKFNHIFCILIFLLTRYR